MIFTYWQGALKDIQSFLTDWEAAGQKVQVHDDRHVRPLIATFYPAFCYTLYDQLRIAACKSDIARTVLLERHGGLYVDAHTGPGNKDELSRLLSMLKTKELVVFDQVEAHAGPGDITVPNGAILGRAGSRLLRAITTSAFDNLLEHWAKERQANKYVGYNIAAMTGGWNIITVLFDLGKKPFRMWPHYADAAHLEVLHPGNDRTAFHWYRHYHYRRPGEHWSERQNTECLFDPSRRWWAISQDSSPTQP